METIRWGIVGAGRMAGALAGDFAFVPGAELSAVAARDIGRAEEFARRHRIPRAFDTIGRYYDHSFVLLKNYSGKLFAAGT